MPIIAKDNIILEILFKSKGARNVQKETGGIQKSLSRVSDFVKGNLIANGITAIANQAGGLVREMASLAIQSEQTKVSFELFTGSAEAATDLI